MAEDRKHSVPSTSKQTESEVPDVNNVEDYVQSELKKSEIIPASISVTKSVNNIFVMSKGDMSIGGYHASGNSRMIINNGVKDTSGSNFQSEQNVDSKDVMKNENIKKLEISTCLKNGMINKPTDFINVFGKTIELLTVENNIWEFYIVIDKLVLESCNVEIGEFGVSVGDMTEYFPQTVVKLAKTFFEKARESARRLSTYQNGTRKHRGFQFPNQAGHRDNIRNDH